MGEPKFIATPKGDELVILTRADYDALIEAVALAEEAEDAADLAVAEKAYADWQEAGKPGYPLDVVHLLRAGMSPIKAFRKYRKLSQQQLAKAAGIAKGYLSAIEQGRKTPCPESIVELARILEVTPASLFPLS